MPKNITFLDKTYDIESTQGKLDAQVAIGNVLMFSHMTPNSRYGTPPQQTAQQVMLALMSNPDGLAYIESDVDWIKNVALMRWTDAEAGQLSPDIQLARKYYTEKAIRIWNNGVNHYSGYSPDVGKNFRAGSEPEQKTDGDGNCFFRSLARAQGDESKHFELRGLLVDYLASPPGEAKLKAETNSDLPIIKDLYDALSNMEQGVVGYTDAILTKLIEEFRGYRTTEQTEAITNKRNPPTDVEIFTALAAKQQNGSPEAAILTSEAGNKFILTAIKNEGALGSIETKRANWPAVIREISASVDKELSIRTHWLANMRLSGSWGGSTCLYEAFSAVYNCPVVTISQGQNGQLGPQVSGKLLGLDEIKIYMNTKKQIAQDQTRQIEDLGVANSAQSKQQPPKKGEGHWVINSSIKETTTDGQQGMAFCDFVSDAPGNGPLNKGSEWTDTELARLEKLRGVAQYVAGEDDEFEPIAGDKDLATIVEEALHALEYPNGATEKRKDWSKISDEDKKHIEALVRLGRMCYFYAPPAKGAKDERTNEAKAAYRFFGALENIGDDNIKDNKIKPWAVGGADSYIFTEKDKTDGVGLEDFVKKLRDEQAAMGNILSAKKVEEVKKVKTELGVKKESQAEIKQSPIAKKDWLEQKAYTAATDGLEGCIKALSAACETAKLNITEMRKNFVEWRKGIKIEEGHVLDNADMEDFKKKYHNNKLDVKNLELMKAFENWYKEANKLGVTHWMPTIDKMTNGKLKEEIQKLTKTKNQDFWGNEKVKEKFDSAALNMGKVKISAGQPCVSDGKKVVMSAHMTLDEQPFFTMKTETSFAELEKHKDEIKAVLGEGTLAISVELKTEGKVKKPPLCYFLVAQGFNVCVKPKGKDAEREMLISRIINPRENWMSAVGCLMSDKLPDRDPKGLGPHDVVGFEGESVGAETNGTYKYDKKAAVESLVYGVLGLPKGKEEISSEARAFLLESEAKLKGVTANNKDEPGNKEIAAFMELINKDEALKAALQSACEKDDKLSKVAEVLKDGLPQPELGCRTQQ